MAASDTELFFELTNSVFVQSVESPNAINGPVFTADDIRPILLKLLRRTSPTSVEVIDLTGVTVQMGIGTPDAVPTVITSATSSTVDSSGFLPITLPFNLAAVQTALGTNKLITPTVEFRVILGVTPQRFQTTCTLRQRLLTGTVQDPEPPGVAVTLAEVTALMVPRDGSQTPTCSGFIVLDELDPTKSYFVSCRGGQIHAEPLQ